MASAASRCRFKKRSNAREVLLAVKCLWLLGDVAMCLAIKTKLGLNDASVTAEMKTNFLGAAKREGVLLYS